MRNKIILLLLLILPFISYSQDTLKEKEFNHNEIPVFVPSEQLFKTDTTLSIVELNNISYSAKRLKYYSIISIVSVFVISLSIIVYLQRRLIKSRDKEILEQLKNITEKNTYLEHAAKIIRHDMHSGINTYIPRGVSSLERRLNPDIIKSLKLESPLKMIKEGLKHTQKVYKGVYEFTNLVKDNSILSKEKSDLKEILIEFLSNTSYISQVKIADLPTIEVNQSLFCTAIDNLIRNGLKYNDSDTKRIDIYSEGDYLIIQDNGRGMTQKEFEHLSQPYTRKDGQKESGTGLGLNICYSILNEHNFKLSCEKIEKGTKMKIKINN